MRYVGYVSHVMCIKYVDSNGKQRWLGKICELSYLRQVSQIRDTWNTLVTLAVVAVVAMVATFDYAIGGIREA